MHLWITRKYEVQAHDLLIAIPQTIELWVVLYWAYSRQQKAAVKVEKIKE